MPFTTSTRRQRRRDVLVCFLLCLVFPASRLPAVNGFFSMTRTTRRVTTTTTTTITITSNRQNASTTILATPRFLSRSPLREENNHQHLSTTNRTDDSFLHKHEKDETTTTTTITKPPREEGGGGDLSDDDKQSSPSFWQSWLSSLQSEYSLQRKRPPWQVDDVDLLLYDVFLLVNLVISIDFWVVHRMQVGPNLAFAVNEACLVSLCWIVAGLYQGAFLDSAVDGHWPASDPRAGPLAAARLALNTFVHTVNVRLLVALTAAVLQHRPALSGVAEDLLPLELGLGLVLMPAWRLLHSSFTPRM